MGLPKGYAKASTSSGWIAILYKTAIVESNLDGSIRLNSGGWRTRHTLKCMNLALDLTGFHVYQSRGDWYVRNMVTGKVLDFQDGMMIR